MEIRQLRHLMALAEYGNFQRAADAVGLSQSALSRSIQTLERDLECAVVDRSSREFHLTGPGELVLQHARKVLASTQNLRSDLQHLQGLGSGEVRFASGIYAAQLLIPKALAAFVQEHPGIQVRYIIGAAEQMRQALKERRIEFFIGSSRNFHDDPMYRVERLGRTQGYFFCRIGHPLLDKTPRQLEDLINYPRVGGRVPSAVHKVLCSIIEGGEFQMSIECTNFDAILNIVMCSDAVGLASVDTLYSPLHRGQVVLLEFENVPYDLIHLHVYYGIITRSDHVLSPTAQNFINILRHTDESLLRRGSGKPI